MKETFERIRKQETNENTALILMLGVLGEKLNQIIEILEKPTKSESKEETVKIYYMALMPEDYD